MPMREGNKSKSNQGIQPLLGKPTLAFRLIMEKKTPNLIIIVKRDQQLKFEKSELIKLSWNAWLTQRDANKTIAMLGAQILVPCSP